MEKYGSIEQFKNVIQSVRRYADKTGTNVPTLNFIGTVKIHGTNAGICKNLKTGEISFQSRERVLDIHNDNAGFCNWGIQRFPTINWTFFNITSSKLNDDNFIVDNYEKIVIYGEWCGPGVQKGVAVSQLDRKIFVVFNITLINGENRYELNPIDIQQMVARSEDIFTIYDFPTWEIAIDFNAPQLVQNQLVELTHQVENECPVGKYFGISGTGEGIVWWNIDTDLKFKVKGEKHAVSKVKTLSEIAAVDIERMNSINEFIDTVMTENRLNQGLAKLSEMGLEVDIKNTGTFIQWCVKDALKEEAAVIEASNFDVKELGGKLSAKAKKFWFETLNKV